MLKTWIKLLPIFVVEHLAKKGCEGFVINVGTDSDPIDIVVVNPFKGVYIEIEDD